MATHSSTAWRILWTEEPGELEFMETQRFTHNWRDLACNDLKSLLSSMAKTNEDSLWNLSTGKRLLAVAYRTSLLPPYVTPFEAKYMVNSTKISSLLLFRLSQKQSCCVGLPGRLRKESWPQLTGNLLSHFAPFPSSSIECRCDGQSPSSHPAVSWP